MKNLFRAGIFSVVTLALHSPFKSLAQLSLGAQLRTRAELRDGQGAPLPEGAKPATFISQRTRLIAGFTGYRFKVGLSVQDVRVWGQDASTINRTTTQDNNGLMVHEAWAEVMLTDTTLKNKTFSIKLGRQELVYDDSRLLGNLDWLQQGRRHDAALLKYEVNSWMLHLGGAFNQNKETASGTVYNPTPPGNYTANTNGGAMYKSLEFFYAGKKFEKGNVSFLFLSDQFSKYHSDNSVKTWETGTWTRFTTGFFFTNTFNKATLTASAYYQGGKNAVGQNLSAGMLTANAMFALNKTFSIGPGIDYTTGGTSGSTSKAFDPLYGTPHKFWGLMDYYYAASGFGGHGLQDFYIKSKLKATGKLLLAADVHQFLSASDVTSTNNVSYSRNFGTEADVVATYNLTKVISFEAGYSHYWSTSSLVSETVKNVANAKSNSNWAYLMINIKPDFMLK
jgi:hypothetical protein